MSNTLNKILLKPRFKVHLDIESLLKRLSENLNDKKCIYPNKISGNHIFIDLPEEEQRIWSPQLHLEIEVQEKGSLLKGLFAPKPGIWTFFMFLHFAVALCFMVFFVIVYSKWSIGSEYKIPFIICLLMVGLWILLYVVGQIGKRKARMQIKELRKFLKTTLRGISYSQPD